MEQPDLFTYSRSQRRLTSIIERILSIHKECEWFEFKLDNEDPQMIGELISALSNGACLSDEEAGFILWGVKNQTSEVIGTTFEYSKKVGNQPLQFWLSQRLNPAPLLRFHQILFAGKMVVMLEINAATDLPVEFERSARIRVGESTPRLRDYPEIEKALLAKCRPFQWEKSVAKSDLTDHQVLDLLDLDAFLRLRAFQRPSDNSLLLEKAAENHMIKRSIFGSWDITNLGAVLLARDLGEFPDLERKSIRIIQYTGTDSLEARPEQTWSQGYAVGFSTTLRFLEGVLPAKEVIGAVREEARAYPSEAIKELLANALIHQDMTITGIGPKIEIFSDRIEFSNAGEPVIDWRKLFGAEPRSRNERLAFAMRKMGLCEERGTGLKRIIISTNAIRLLPPEFNVSKNSTNVILHGFKRDFEAMDPNTKNRAIYQYACLLREEGTWLTNGLLRKRFPITGNATMKASMALRACVSAGFIKKADPSRPNSGYIPAWA